MCPDPVSRQMKNEKRRFKTNQKIVRGTSNLLLERILSTVVFKMDVFYVSLKEEIPNKTVSEILGSLPLKIFSSMLRMLWNKTDLSSEKNGQ